MYYKTKKDSDTGYKLSEVVKEIDHCHDKVVKLSEEIGFNRWVPASFVVSGGVWAVLFPKDFVVDKKIWKRRAPEKYYPKTNTKEGKLLAAKFENLPTVSYSRLNNCVGYEKRLGHIGFSYNNDEYYVFETDGITKINLPSDCTEITHSEYRELAGKK